jgi:hypothetical protein
VALFVLHDVIEELLLEIHQTCSLISLIKMEKNKRRNVMPRVLTSENEMVSEEKRQNLLVQKRRSVCDDPKFVA